MFLRLLSFAVIVISLFALPKLSAVVAWDQWMVVGLAAWRTEGWTYFFWLLSRIGGTWGFCIVLTLPTLLFLLRRRFAAAIWYAVGVGLLKLSASLWKLGVARPRPPDGLQWLSTFSMPSGHAVNAVLMFGLLWMFVWPRMKFSLEKILLTVLCGAGIFLIGFSRVYLGVHYPSDVLLGWLYAACGLWMLQGMRKDVFRL